MAKHLKHIEWLKTKYWQQITDKITQSPHSFDENSVDSVLSTLAKADPSEKKLAVDWMLKVWLNNGFLWEDVRSGERSKTYETLAMFAKHRSMVSRENRNLTNHTSLGSVWRAVEPFEQALEKDKVSSRELKRELKEKVLSETLVLKHTSDQIAIVPLTQESSMWWGKGTRWCTAAREDNYFDQYNSAAPLIILVLPQGLTSDPDKKARKFQLWTNNNNINFMDEADEAVDPSLVAHNWSDFAPLIEWAVENNINAVEYIPQDQWTVELRNRIVNENISLANKIPLRLLDEEFCHQWIVRDINFVNMIDRHNLSLNNRKLAVSIYPHYLHLLPDEEKTLEICWNAINRSCRTFHDVPDRFKTKDLCDRVLHDYPNFIHLVPDQFITQEICNRAINYDNYYLKKIPLKFRTREVCAKALHANFNSIDLIPENLLDEQMIMEAILANEASYIIDWKFIPDHLLTENVVHCYIKDNSYELSELLKKSGKNNCLETISLVLEKWGENALEDILEAVTDKGIVEYLTDKYPQSIYHLKDTVFENTITEEKCIKAVLDGLHLSYVPEKFRTKEVCRVAVKSYMGNIGYISTELGSKFLKELIDENPEILGYCKYANKVLATNEFWIECLEQYSKTIELVPENIITPEIMNKLLEKDVSVCKRISKDSEREWMFLLAVEKQPSIINELAAKWQTEAVQEQAIKAGFPQEEIRIRKEPAPLYSGNIAKKSKITFVNWNHSELDGLKQRLVSRDRITSWTV